MASAMAFPPYHGNIDNKAGVKVMVVAIMFPALATLTVALRLFLRYTTKLGLGADDISIVGTLLMLWGSAACCIYMWHDGMGLHVTEIPVKNLLSYLRSLYAFELFYIADFGLCKVSILFFYQRVFSVTQRRRNLVWGLMGFMILFTVVFELIFVFQCMPLHYFWTRLKDPKGLQGKCMNPLILYGVYTAINIITDVLIWLYPLPIVWKLQVSNSKKAGLALVFVAGALVCVISIIRATTIPKIVSLDFSYADMDAGIWALLECSVACIVACLPTMRVLFTRSKPNSRNRSTGYSGSGSGSGASNPKKNTTNNMIVNSNNGASVQSRSWFECRSSSSNNNKKWGSGIETTIDITQDLDPEDGVPLKESRDGWSRLDEEGHSSGGIRSSKKQYGW